MRNWIFLAVIFSLGIMQATLLDIFRIFNLKADLLLASVVIASLLFGSGWAVFYSLCAGIAKDVFSHGEPASLNTVMFVLYSLLLTWLSRKITLENNYLRTALVFMIALLHNVITGFVWICLGKTLPYGIFFRVVFLASFYTACAFLVLLKVSPKEFLAQ